MTERTDNILRGLWNIEMALEPENLYCDGEISRAAALRKQRVLQAEQKKLQKELGYIPSFDELYKAAEERRKAWRNK